MTWLDAPKSEHIVRREHYVAGREDERERIYELLRNATFYFRYEGEKIGDLISIEGKEVLKDLIDWTENP